MDGALLELKLVGDIAGSFRVARYQRGYRWGSLEVERLLNDIWESKGEPYSLQPIVVKRDGEAAWELVDGQQRLTTLFLIFQFMQREKLQNASAPYSITYDTRPDSEVYLQSLDAERADSNGVTDAAVRKSLLELLLDMDAFAFEHLVKRLLEEMDYQNVEVTTRSGDGGVDVVADIELGITSVREVVQAKKHRRPIQRKDLDALRGSLYRFNAVRGTIVTTSRFAKGTQEAAFAGGAAPITLIDGEKLIDLLIEHGIGVRKRTLEVLAVDVDLFAELEGEV